MTRERLFARNSFEPLEFGSICVDNLCKNGSYFSKERVVDSYTLIWSNVGDGLNEKSMKWFSVNPCKLSKANLEEGSVGRMERQRGPSSLSSQKVSATLFTDAGMSRKFVAELEGLWLLQKCFKQVRECDDLMANRSPVCSKSSPMNMSCFGKLCLQGF